MIYTVGRRDVYEGALAMDPKLKKLKGGSVWKTKEDAQQYLQDTRQDKTFLVYGIEADWDKDTDEVRRAPWHALNKNARIKRI